MLSDGPLLSEMRDQFNKPNFKISAVTEAIVRSQQFREICGKEMASEDWAAFKVEAREPDSSGLTRTRPQHRVQTLRDALNVRLVENAFVRARHHMHGDTALGVVLPAARRIEGAEEGMNRGAKQGDVPGVSSRQILGGSTEMNVPELLLVFGIERQIDGVFGRIGEGPFCRRAAGRNTFEQRPPFALHQVLPLLWSPALEITEPVPGVPNKWQQRLRPP